MENGDRVAGSWQETVGSFTAMAGDNTDAALGMKLGFWAMVLICIGPLLALPGLFFGLRGLVSGRIGGRKAALAAIGMNAVVIALDIVIVLIKAN